MSKAKSQSKKSFGALMSEWLLTNYGESYINEVERQRARENARNFKTKLSLANEVETTEIPIVGIIGGGFAGLYAGLILQSLGIEFEIFESTDRVGGRIHTWYSEDYSRDRKKKKYGLYGEIGGMRLPQFSEDMLPVQQLALAVNSVLKRNGLDDDMVYWRKFYYNSEVQRLRYNNMPSFIVAKDASLNSLNFDEQNGGDIPQIWFIEKTDSKGNKYIPINQVFGQVVGKFVTGLSKSFAKGFKELMKYDQYSMWSYLTTVFTLGDLGEYYDTAFGNKSNLLPWSVANYLETTNVGTNMDLVSFVEMVIAVYDWNGSLDPYLSPDNPIAQNPFTQVFMLTVDNGMQCFPDACKIVLNLNDAVTIDDGITAQIQLGILPAADGRKSYSPPNLTQDAQPPSNTNSSYPTYVNTANNTRNSSEKQRVFLKHKVIETAYHPELYEGHGGMKVKIRNESVAENDCIIEKQYPYIISTLPFGKYFNGEPKCNILNGISFAKARAIRECNYMSSFKAFLTFKKQFWAELGERQDKGLGAASTDRPNRQIIYPSYGYPENGNGATEGVLQVYCWAEDASRLGALSDEARVNECLKGIQFLYPEIDIYEHFSGYNDGVTTKTWFWDQHSGGGAFALFAPEQFKYMYPTLLTPEFDGCLHIAGEACSVHHGWIVGALDSAYNAVYHILQHSGAHDKIEEMGEIWGQLSPPDIGKLSKNIAALNKKKR